MKFDKLFFLLLICNGHFYLESMESIPQVIDESQEPIESIQLRAKSGSTAAQYELAWRYLEGRKGVMRSTEQAEQLFVLVGKKGNAHALHQCGIIALKRGDYDNAKAYFRSAAEAGEILSSYELAKIYGKTGHEPSLRQEAVLLKEILESEQLLAGKDPAYAMAVRKACASAACRLGDLHELGIAPVQYSIEKAEQYFKKALEFEACHDEALYRLGRLFVLGFSRTGSKEEGITFLQRVSDSHLRAQTLLGKTHFDNGDYSQAVLCLKKAYQESGEAAHYVAVCLEKGAGINKDAQQALILYIKAAKKGYKPSCKKLLEGHVEKGEVIFALGELYRDGICVDVNEGEAVRFFLLADEAHISGARSALEGMAKTSAEAQYALGCLSVRDNSKDDNGDTATVWFQKASLKGHSNAFAQLNRLVNLNNRRAMLVLAEFHANGQAGCERNRKRCFELLDQSVELGCADAALMYAEIYTAGLITEKNEEEAMKWYAKAVVLNSNAGLEKLQSMAEHNPHAQCALGHLLEEGKGVAKNITQAEILYRKASQAGCIRGHFLLAEFLESQPAKSFKDLASIIVCYREILNIYDKAVQAGSKETLKNCYRIKKIILDLEQLQKEHSNLDFENILFLTLCSELPSSCSLEVYCWTVHNAEIANRYFSDRVKDAVCKGLLKLCRYDRKQRLPVMLMQLISKILYSKEFSAQQLDGYSDGKRVQIIDKICNACDAMLKQLTHLAMELKSTSEVLDAIAALLELTDIMKSSMAK